MTSGDADGYELAYREGKAAISEQAATLRETRDRAGTVVSAGAVIAALGTSLGLSDGRASELTLLGWIGLGAAAVGFLVVVLGAVMVWRPIVGLFVLDAGMIVGSYVEGDPPANITEIHRELALHLGNHMAHNRGAISDRLTWFTASLWAFLGLVAGLGIMLIDVTT